MKSGGLVTLNDDKYTEFMLNGDRDFDAILLYTTMGNRYRCALCPWFLNCDLTNSVTNREFGLVASAYDSQAEKANTNVLFIRVPIDLAPGVFQFHEFTTAPIITFLSATDRVTKRVLICLFSSPAQLEQRLPAGLSCPCRRHRFLRPFQDPHHRTLSLSLHSLQIPIHRFPWPQVIIACLFVFGLPLAAFIYLFQYERVYSLLGNYRIYLVISLLVYESWKRGN